MIPIKKGTPPQALNELKNRAIRKGLSPKDAYKTLKNPLKTEVLNNLVEEQGHLCAYCMCSIPRRNLDPQISAITIEHFIPESPQDSRDVGQGLDYSNFLAVCNGNTAKKGKRKYIDLTCDSHRGNKEFKKINPCIPNTLSNIFYTMDGVIGATDPDVKEDIENILNLNCPNSPLVSERKEALTQLTNDMGYMEDKSELLLYCKKRLDAFSNEPGRRTEYVGILIWYLKSMIGALENI